MKQMQRILIAVSMCVAAAWSQGTWPLKQISVEGNRTYTDEQLIAASGLTTGGQYTRDSLQERLEAAQGKLLASGVLESVAFRFGGTSDGKGYAVTFEVAEIEQAYPIEFENIDAPDEELRAWLKERDPLYAATIPGTDTQIQRYARLIEEYLKERGSPEEIRGELTSSLPDELFVMFHPKGAMPVIAEVAFEGNKVVPEERLREAIHGVAVGTRFSEALFRMLLTSNLLPVYGTRGRINTTFPKIETEPAGGGVNGVRVKVTVDEGESFSYGVVRVEGTASMDRELLSATGLQPGEVANMTEIPTALERVKDALRMQGYMDARASEEHEIVRDKRVVDVLIRVEPGPKYNFGELHLQGLDLHGEHEIRKIWGMQSGDPFDPTYPDFFLQRIEELNLFTGLQKTVSKAEPNHEKRTVDVTLYFNPKERKARFGVEDPLDSGPRR